MYWKRQLAPAFREALSHFPAVLITGPRQSGKTTFLQREAPEGHAYVSFDDPLHRDEARKNPKGFLDRFANRVLILDEIQYAPELFSYLKMRIDEHRSRSGRFILTGSQQFQMMRHVSDSLAGRVCILDMLPFAVSEFPDTPPRTIEQVLWEGGYPPVATHPRTRDAWVKSYIATYVERDVRQLQVIKDLQTFETFLGLCAARHGQLLNSTELARDCGITYVTCRNWLSVLAASFILRSLPPYHENFGKRLVKSHKMYFVDPAIPACLTRIPTPEGLWRGPSGGSFFEGWIVMEAFKFFAGLGRRADLNFWRSHDGTEVDLLVEAQGRLFPVEIKQTATPRALHAEPIERFRRIAGEARCGEGIVVCCTSEPVMLARDVTAIPWQAFPAWLEKITPAR